MGRTPCDKRDERTLEHRRHVGSRMKRDYWVALHKQDRLGPHRKRSDPCKENSHHQQYVGVKGRVILTAKQHLSHNIQIKRRMATKTIAQKILVLAGTEELKVWVVVSFFAPHDTGRTPQQAYPPFQETSSNGTNTKVDHRPSVFVAASVVLKDSSERHGNICSGSTRNRNDWRWVVRDHLYGLSGDKL